MKGADGGRNGARKYTLKLRLTGFSLTEVSARKFHCHALCHIAGLWQLTRMLEDANTRTKNNHVDSDINQIWF